MANLCPQLIMEKKRFEVFQFAQNKATVLQVCGLLKENWVPLEASRLI
jgi:hypothetical protein